ncbi:hypothetical protein BC830DRAFT_777792 [Chytriomyces sp. MP71]|nr:hypothetical protein BC830DRAFT_777792 [Chytriomyces sp. MP71]
MFGQCVPAGGGSFWNLICPIAGQGGHFSTQPRSLGEKTYRKEKEQFEMGIKVIIISQCIVMYWYYLSCARTRTQSLGYHEKRCTRQTIPNTCDCPSTNFFHVASGEVITWLTTSSFNGFELAIARFVTSFLSCYRGVFIRKREQQERGVCTKR